jgi:tRNA(fMet)-specific endonuclease VapC
MNYLLDTNICVYIIKERPRQVLERFRTQKIGDIAISTITIAELEYGVSKSQMAGKNRDALIKFLLPLEVVDFDVSDALEYGIIRSDLEQKGQIIGSMDMLIAAQAVAKGLTLVTNNLREFQRVRGLVLENWV